LIAGRSRAEALFKPLHTGFAGWLNHVQGTLGPVFADRPLFVAVASARAACLLAYVHNNPVRAGVVASAARSTWTSHQFYLDARPAPPWLRVEQGLALAGFDTT